MRLCVLSYIGTEDDIVELFVRHTVRYADRLIVVSTAEGETRNVLSQMVRGGLPLEVICHEPAFHDQHQILTKLLHQNRHEADWFLLLDADEFVTGDIRTALENSEPALRSLPWKTYVPVTGDNPYERNVLKRIRHRRSPEVPQFTKIVIPSAAIRWDTHIGRGNHTVSSFSFPYRWRWQWGTPLHDVSIAHFPVRDTWQMTQKIDRSWPAVMRNPRRKNDEAFHWRWMYEQYRDVSIDSNTLTEIALRYSLAADAPLPDIVEDPVI